MAGRIVPNAVPITEWGAAVNSKFSEACGEASTAMALHVLKGTPATVAFVIELEHAAINAGQTVDLPRASMSANNVSWLFKQNGVSSTIHWGDWQSAVQSMAGSLPIVLGITKAYVLGGADASEGIHGHFLCIFGIDNNGVFIVGDPNTTESTQGQFVHYSLSQLQAAAPFAAIVPQENPLGSIPFVGGLLIGVTAPINQQLYNLSGFTGIVEAIHQDEQFEPFQMANVTEFWKLPDWLHDNFRAVLLRSMVIIAGLVIILAVLIQTMKQADPQFWQSMSAPSGGGMPAMPSGGGAPAASGGAGATLPPEAAVIA